MSGYSWGCRNNAHEANTEGYAEGYAAAGIVIVIVIIFAAACVSIGKQQQDFPLKMSVLRLKNLRTRPHLSVFLGP